MRGCRISIRFHEGSTRVSTISEPIYHLEQDLAVYYSIVIFKQTQFNVGSYLFVLSGVPLTHYVLIGYTLWKWGHNLLLCRDRRDTGLRCTDWRFGMRV